MNAPLHLNGLPVFVTPLATSVEWYVARHPIRKRRRQWTVKSRSVPSAFVTDMNALGLFAADGRYDRKAFFVHPAVFDKLRGFDEVEA